MVPKYAINQGGSQELAQIEQVFSNQRPYLLFPQFPTYDSSILASSWHLISSISLDPRKVISRASTHDSSETHTIMELPLNYLAFLALLVPFTIAWVIRHPQRKAVHHKHHTFTSPTVTTSTPTLTLASVKIMQTLLPSSTVIADSQLSNSSHAIITDDYLPQPPMKSVPVMKGIVQKGVYRDT